MAGKVLTVKHALAITDVIELLENSPDPEKVIHEPPQRPKAGQVFLYSSEQDPDAVQSELYAAQSGGAAYVDCIHIVKVFYQ